MLTRDKAINRLIKSTGKTEMQLYEDATFDSVADAICMDCGAVTRMEPDQDAGWCSECEKNNVKSCLIIGGIL